MHKFLFYKKFIVCLYMFRALYPHHQEVKVVQDGSNMTGNDLCVNLATSVPVIFEPPSIIQHLVSLHSASGRPVHRLREDSSPRSTCAPDGHL